MPDLTGQTFVTRDPGAYAGTLIGTAAGTTTIQTGPCFFAGILIPTRVASGALTIYDSVGTSANVVGTLTLGTQTFSDPPPTYWFKQAMKTGLTIVNSANQGALILSK